MDTGLARRGLPVVAEARDGGALVHGRVGADGTGDRAPDGRLGDHLAVHASSGAGRDGRARRAGGSGSGTVPARLRRRRSSSTTPACRRTRPLGRCGTPSTCGVLGGGAFEYEGEAWSAPRRRSATTPCMRRRTFPCVRRGDFALRMQALAGEIADGCLTPSITTPAFVRYMRENVAADIDIGCTVVASIHADDRNAGCVTAREIAGMYLANKVQNIRGRRRHAARARRDRPGGDPAGCRSDGSRRSAGREGRGHRLHPRPVQADRGHAARLRRRDRGVPRRGLHPRHARAVGRPAARADPALRRPRCCRTSGRDDRRTSSRRSRPPAGVDAVVHRAEEPAAAVVRDELVSMGLQVQWQQVEEGRANVVEPGRAAVGGRR